MEAFAATGYFLPLLKLTELVAGLLLLSKSYAPLGVLLFFPIVVQINLFHFFLAPAGLPLSVLLALLEAYLVKQYFYLFYPFFFPED